jgi:hypothetical protein
VLQAGDPAPGAAPAPLRRQWGQLPLAAPDPGVRQARPRPDSCPALRAPRQAKGRSSAGSRPCAPSCSPAWGAEDTRSLQALKRRLWAWVETIKCCAQHVNFPTQIRSYLRADKERQRRQCLCAAAHPGCKVRAGTRRRRTGSL